MKKMIWTYNRGGLLVPFALILSLFSLLLGALAGNSIGRSNQATGKVSPLDVYAPKEAAPPTLK